MATQFVLTNGELIRKARKEAGLDQAQLAALVGVRRETVCSWETNHSEPSARQVKRIEKATGALWLWPQLRPHVSPLTCTKVSA